MAEYMLLHEPDSSDFALRVGRATFTRAGEPLMQHMHPGMYEIVYLARGRQLYSVAGRMWELAGGDVFLTRPDEPHGSLGHPQEKSILYYVIVDLNRLNEGYLSYGAEEAQSLARALAAVGQRVFRGSDAMKRSLEALFERSPQEDPYRRTRLRNHISDFLLEVVRCGETQGVRAHRADIGAVCAHIEQNLHAELGVRELAAFCGLSETRFQEAFRRTMGMPPREYVLRRKVEEAKRLLVRTPCSVTEIAQALAFSTSQYFATVFRRFTGTSPLACRRAGKAGEDGNEHPNG